LPIRGVSCDFLFDHTRVSAQHPANEREINFFHRARRKLERQTPMRVIVLCDHDASACFFIEAMHDAGPFLSTNAGKSGAMIE